MLQVFLTRTHLAIAMEYAQGGDLFRYVLRHKAARLAESQARWIFQQLVIGLDFCHRSVRTPVAACLGLGICCLLCTQSRSPTLCCSVALVSAVQNDHG